MKRKSFFCRITRVFVVLIFMVGILSTFTACEAVTDVGQRVGIGNTLIFTLFGILVTAVVGFVGFLFSLIPVIGKFFGYLTIGIIVFGWIIFVIATFTMYGWAMGLIGMAGAGIVLGALFGGGVYTIFIGFF